MRQLSIPCWASAIFLLLSVACRAPLPAPSVERVSSTATVTTTDLRIPSPGLSGSLRYRAIVPTAQPGERLGVLYLLHGANSGPDEIQQQSSVTQLAASAHLIVVIPEAGLSYYTNARHLRHAQWEDAIVLDLLRDAETRFPVLAGREHRGIAGISMGGYGAVKLALKHPELYSFVADMSGALDITHRRPSLHRLGQTWRIWSIFGLRPPVRQHEDVFNLLDHSPDISNTQWFLSCGKDDPLYPVNLRFLHLMRARGAHIDAIATPGGHNWQSWNLALPLVFQSAARTLH